MTKAIKTLFIYGLIVFMGACNNADISLNTTNITSSKETNEIVTTDLEITTDLPNTTEATTSEQTSEETTEIPTTTETTTSVPTTTEVPTTEQPTTIPTTTEATTIEWVTIYFENVSGATTVNTLSSIPGNSFTMPDDPIRPGYVFGGWFVDESLTIPFNITVYPDNDMTVYAKWTEETNPADEIMAALESNYEFICDNNVCTLEEYSWLIYTFNFNDFTFKKELIDDDASDNQTKHEVVIIDEDWDVSYSFSIQYLSNTASMTVSGDASTGTYNSDSFPSNPTSYLTESNVYNDALDFISEAVIFLDFIVDILEIDYNDLKEQK
ncbi:MAG: InlB B-repeat-containing protein [Tenericutes bacterium]|jgi:uncharacterized repeat protein (TIGR02543 family)|nr:InlB B-repeat-containing protein [Mycoplasmatota bacterium]